MENKKPCPVDRGKLLIGLECSAGDGVHCQACLYDSSDSASCVDFLVKDAAAYIGWLEEKVEALEAEKPNIAWAAINVLGDDGSFWGG